MVLPGIELGTSCTRYHYDTMPLETHWEDVDNILLKAFSLELPSACLV